MTQVIRIRDEYGKEWLKVQLISSCLDRLQNWHTTSYNLGAYQFPLFRHTYSCYNQYSGLKEGLRSDLHDFRTEYRIPFSAAQIRALEKHFAHKVSLILTLTTRRYSVEKSDDFVKRFDEVKDIVASKPKGA